MVLGTINQVINQCGKHVCYLVDSFYFLTYPISLAASCLVSLHSAMMLIWL